MTFDGQHTHEEGTKIMMNLFADHLQGFDIWGGSASPAPASATSSASESDMDAEVDSDTDTETNSEQTSSSKSTAATSPGGKSYQAEKVQKLGELNDRLASNPELVLNAKMDVEDTEESGYAAVEAARCKRGGCNRGFIIGLDDPETLKKKRRSG